MNAASYPYALDLQLPWQEDAVQKEKFKRILKRMLIPLLLFLLIMPWLPTVEKDYEERELDIVKTKIMLEPLVVEPVATPTPVPKAKPKPVQQPLQKESKKPLTAKQKEKEKKKKSVAEAQGLTALSSELNALRQSLDLTKLQKKNVSTSESGKIARADSTVLGEDKLNQKSEGIKVDDSMMKNQNVALAAHKSATLDGFVDDGAPAVDSENFYSDLKGVRSTESIRRVLEAGKSRSSVHYQRALRQDADLSGVLVFELVIEANGTISHLELISSEFNSPELEKKILATIKKLMFDAEDVSPRKIVYKFNFLPSN
ncbi:MAG: AgmX/PglI C-terminal domain-containing protein [Agarilytica sp.]